jgi:hypothetical protein
MLGIIGLAGFGADKCHNAACFLEPIVGIPEFEIFVEFFDQNGHSFAGYTHGMSSFPCFEIVDTAFFRMIPEYIFDRNGNSRRFKCKQSGHKFDQQI